MMTSGGKMLRLLDPVFVTSPLDVLGRSPESPWTSSSEDILMNK